MPRFPFKIPDPRQGAATALLACMALLEVGTHFMPVGPVRFCLQSAAKAGLIGGIADWFAVTALFRHPLGLPIPHTAILPAQQARLAEGLGRFIGDHILTESELRRALAASDASLLIAGWLTDPVISASLAQSLSGMAGHLVSALDEKSTVEAIGRTAAKFVSPGEISQALARLLRDAMRNGRHQSLLTSLLPRLKAFLTERDQQLRSVVQERVREQGGRLIGWAAGASIAARVIDALLGELDKIAPEDSPVREAFDVWLEHEIHLLETDPDRIATIGGVWRRAWRQPGLQAVVADLWERLRAGLRGAAAEPRLSPVFERALRQLGETLATDLPMQERWLHAIEKTLQQFLPLVRPRVASFIGGVVGGWDRRSLVQKLETRLMGDLQWVRINGTMVGFILGALLALLP